MNVSIQKWARSRFIPCIPLGDNRSCITACEKHVALSRRAACEGTVLLKNTGGFLPLPSGAKIAVFGNAQIDYVKGGSGSGIVHTSYVRNLYEGLKMKAGKIDVFDPLSLFYQEYVLEAYRRGGENGRLTEPEIPSELLLAAAAYADTAIVTICRFSGEGYDKRNDDKNKYFELEDGEKKMVADVLSHFENVVVLLNVGAMIDTSWFAENDRVKAALLLWQGGMEGGLAAADMLVGDDAPSGKLVDTCVRAFEDYPSSEGFHESADYVKYTEDIFVGYRYFETIPGKQSAVVYPFGYGLTYTSFEISDIFVCDNGTRIFVSANVKNTGNRAGKEVVEVYYSAPEGRITKERIALAAFAKTPLIQPGEAVPVSLSFEIADMASYDDMGDVEKSAYILEAGNYRVFVGTSVRDLAETDYVYTLAQTAVMKKLNAYCSPTRLEMRLCADGTYREASVRTEEPKVFQPNFTNKYKPVENPLPFDDVATGKITLDDFISQLSDEDLMKLLVGQPNTGVADTGTMGGGRDSFRIPRIATADGPAGLRLKPKTCVPTTAFPVATALACTWNTALVEEIGKAGALECKENNILIWLTPALNIHRSPLCGRNFEYYSEDPLIAGKMAAAMVSGIQSQGVAATPKHFAANNKETNRNESDSIVSERALREIYLRGFEICVKESSPKIIMTSYNLINGVHTSESAELLQGILREEWGYRGMLTTDWSNTAKHYKEVKAGNDIRMPSSQRGQLAEPYEKGLVTRDEMAICAKRILEMILWID